MDKLTMAHEYAMQAIDTGYVCETDTLVTEAWQYADAMQAEADKRTKSEKDEFYANLADPMRKVREHKEWQPDWSQAPEWAKWWVKESAGSYWWLQTRPVKEKDYWLHKNRDSKSTLASSFGYAGAWQDSLRKRPASEYSEAIKTQQNITATAKYHPFMGNGYIDPLKTDDKTCKHELRDIGKYRTCMVCDYIEEVEK